VSSGSQPAALPGARFRLDQNVLYRLYLTVISVAGFYLFLLGLWQFRHFDDKTLFLLLAGLAAVSALLTTSVAVAKSGITYSVGPVVSMAAIPEWGAVAAILISTCFNFCLWLLKPKDQATWKKSGVQLAFNNGLHALAFLTSGWVLVATRDWLSPATPLGQALPWLGLTLPWLIASLIYDEVNLWLLIGVLRLQHGPQIKPLVMWRQDRWASQISVLVMALGGGILFYALDQYDTPAIVIFYLPIVLSAYAFRLYVRQMEAHMNNLEEIVDKRTADLKELNDQKDAYLAVLTHDMMTPLTSIQLCAEELDHDPTAAIENPHLITVLLQSQKTLLNMVRDILDIEKLRSGWALSTNRSACDLAQLLINGISMVQADANGRGISLSYQIERRPLMIYADRQQMERILLNLISNAVKYTPTGGEVHASLYSEGQTVVIEVRDTGYGIPAEELPKLFERFRRVEQTAEKAPGNGLGLAITQALVKEHHGDITVQSEVGKGSIFSVRLPVGEPKDADYELPE
jgi:signal transduction histidine kinase